MLRLNPVHSVPEAPLIAAYAVAVLRARAVECDLADPRLYDRLRLALEALQPQQVRELGDEGPTPMRYGGPACT